MAEKEVMEVLEKPGEDRAGREASRIALGVKRMEPAFGLPRPL